MPNSSRMSAVGILIEQGAFTPDRLAVEISELAANRDRLAAMAAAARTLGRLDAADRLADLILDWSSGLRRIPTGYGPRPEMDVRRSLRARRDTGMSVPSRTVARPVLAAITATSRVYCLERA